MNSAGGGAGPTLKAGFNLRHYEEEITQLKKDNLNLKLRIYLMEERHGLLPTNKRENQENVYR